MNCEKCGKLKPIVNKHYKLCLGCNNSRLRELKAKSNTNIPKKKDSSLKQPKNTIKGYSFVKNLVSSKTKVQKIKEDELFYEKCFNLSDHKCEECGKDLPNTFRDNNNKIVARWRYSHIIPKSTASEIRHSTKNINHLCLLHHMQWENGDKENMKIYKTNKERLPNYF